MLIDENAIEVARIFEQVWSMKSAVLLNQRPEAICQFIDGCCGTENRLKAISLFNLSLAHNMLDRVINTCTDSAALNKIDTEEPIAKQYVGCSLLIE
jgi:hypothetical protein